MKKTTFTICLFFLCFLVAAQKNSSKPLPIKLTETTVVKDTLGNVYPYEIWSPLMVTGRYNIKPETPGDPNTAFVLSRLSDEEYEAKLTTMPKPKESRSFVTGKKFNYFKTTDIDDNKINSKTLAGKIVVLNFWFINCPPCRLEIPELNKLKEEYTDDSSIVFIGVALDDKASLRSFLKTNPFKYTIVDNGGSISDSYAIISFPTNVIVTPEGKVYFHSAGLAPNTVYWLGKSIKELRDATQKKDVAISADN